MTLELELTPLEETRLNQLAGEAGMEPTAYLRSLIDLPRPRDMHNRTNRVLAQIGREAPEIDLSREGIYADF